MFLFIGLLYPINILFIVCIVLYYCIIVLYYCMYCIVCIVLYLLGLRHRDRLRYKRDGTEARLVFLALLAN